MSIQVVLHPAGVPGLVEELRNTEGIKLVEAADNDEVYDALLSEDSVLVTYTWEGRFLTDGLKWVQGVGAGYEQYPLDRFATAEVVLTTATGVHVVVAEAAVGLVLALTRNIAHSVRDAVDHAWQPRDGVELAGSTVGIVGLGTIGEAFARRMQGWDVDLIGFKRDPSSYNGVVGKVYGPDQLLDLCRESDVLVITLPGSEETQHMIGKQQLEALGAGWLVNVGRGSVVDEQALVSALTDGDLLGAGLDVFEVEPLPATSPLWDLENVVITPHSAGNTPRYGERLAKIFQNNLNVFNGGDGQWINRVVDGRRLDKS
jgi:phosphoglycerate dehydrogenase-like enzyme